MCVSMMTSCLLQGDNELWGFQGDDYNRVVCLIVMTREWRVLQGNDDRVVCVSL